MSSTKLNRSFVFILMFAMLFLVAAKPAPVVDYVADQPIIEDSIQPPRACKTNCMISESITIKPLTKGDTTMLLASTRIVDENGKPVSAALVIVRWTLPDGTRIENRVMTDSNGYALFTVQAMQSGDYSLRIHRVIRDGYQFDSTKGDSNGEISI